MGNAAKVFVNVNEQKHVAISCVFTSIMKIKNQHGVDGEEKLVVGSKHGRISTPGLTTSTVEAFSHPKNIYPARDAAARCTCNLDLLLSKIS